MSSTPNSDQMNAINDAIFAGRKIEAIKLYREASGHDLKDSKEFVEKLAAQLYAQYPEKFPISPPQQTATAKRVIIVLAIVFAVIILILLTTK